MSLSIGVPKEVFPGEMRVASVPEVVEKLIKLGFAVAVETGAGEGANCGDDAYRAAGADVVADAATLLGKADIVFKVRPPTAAEVAAILLEETRARRVTVRVEKPGALRGARTVAVTITRKR